MKKFAGSSPGHGKLLKIKKKKSIKTVVLMTKPHLKSGVDSTSETLCKKTL